MYYFLASWLQKSQPITSLSLKQSQKPEEPQFGQSSISYASAKMSLILSCSSEQSTSTSVSHLGKKENNIVLVNLPKLLIPTSHFSQQEFSQVLVSSTLKVVLSHLTFTMNPKSAKPKKRRIITSNDSNAD